MRTLKRVLVVTAYATVVVAVAGALGVWLLVRDEVAALRSARDAATVPLHAPIRNAIVAAEAPVFERPRLSLQMFRSQFISEAEYRRAIKEPLVSFQGFR